MDLNLAELADKNVKWPKVFDDIVYCAFPEDIRALANVISKDRCALREIKTPSKDKVSRPKLTKTTVELQSGVDCLQEPADWRMDGFMQQAEDRAADFGPWAGTGLQFITAQSSIFIGHGDMFHGDQRLRFAGVIHELPAQSGISGFQRLTMVSFDKPESGTLKNGYLDAREEDLEKEIIWTFEGIMLPCGNVILGRYDIGEGWDFTETRRGPFIYWNQDDERPDNARRAFFGDRAGSSEETRGETTFKREHSTTEELSEEQEWLAEMQKMHKGN